VRFELQKQKIFKKEANHFSEMDEDAQNSGAKLKALFTGLKLGAWGSIFNAIASVPLDERPQILTPTTIFYANGRPFCGYFCNKDKKMVKIRTSKNDTWFVSNSWWKKNPNAQEDNRATAYTDPEITTAASVHMSQSSLPLAVAIPTVLRGSTNDFSEDWFECLLGEKLQFCLQNNEMSRDALTRISGLQQIVGGKTGMMQIYCCSYVVAAFEKKPSITYTRRMQQLNHGMTSGQPVKKEPLDDQDSEKSRSIVIRCSNPSINSELKKTTISIVLLLQKLYPSLRVNDINVYFYVDGSGQAWLCHTSAVSFVEKSSGPTALKSTAQDLGRPQPQYTSSIETACLGDFCKTDTNESKWFSKMTPEPKNHDIWRAQLQSAQQIMYKSVVLARLESKFWSERQASAVAVDSVGCPPIFGSLYQYSIQQLTQWISVCSTCAKRYQYLDWLRLEKQSNPCLGASQASVLNTAIVAKLKEDLSSNSNGSQLNEISEILRKRHMKCSSASRMRSRYPFFLGEDIENSVKEVSVKAPNFTSIRTERRPKSSSSVKPPTSDLSSSRWQYSYKKQDAKRLIQVDAESSGNCSTAYSTEHSTPALQSPHNMRPHSAATCFTRHSKQYPTSSNMNSLGSRPKSADGVYYSTNSITSLLLKPFPESVQMPVIVRLDKIKTNWQDSLRSPSPVKKGPRPHADILDTDSTFGDKSLAENYVSHFKYGELHTMPFRIIRDTLASHSSIRSTLIMVSDIMSSMTDLRDSAEIFVASCNSYQVILVNLPGQEFSSFDSSQCNNNEYQSFQLAKFLGHLDQNGVFPIESYVIIEEQKRVPVVDMLAIGFAASAVVHLTKATTIIRVNTMILCNPFLRMNSTVSAIVSAWCSSAEASQITGCDMFGRAHAHSFFSSRYLELSSSKSLQTRDYRPVHLRLPHIVPSSATLAGLVNLLQGKSVLNNCLVAM
jgi:hypothetical protein